jgi:hypothetical protein
LYRYDRSTQSRGLNDTRSEDIHSTASVVVLSRAGTTAERHYSVWLG